MSSGLDKSNITNKISKINNLIELDGLRVYYLGKKGLLTSEMKSLSSLSDEQRKERGQNLNSIKTFLEKELKNKKNTLEKIEIDKKIKKEKVDITLPARNYETGKIHPISQSIYKIIDIFASMGFSVESGPDIESDFNNFTALNIPSHHPAREMQDTFFISKNPDKVLRTHTSNVQIRLMEKQKPPIRVVIPGRVYRNETVSAKSHCFFHQVEGLYVDKDVSFKNLKETLYYFAKEMFGKETKVRFRPSYFPFTEPSAEMDISWKNGWLEILGSGLVDPNVLKNCNIDPEKYSGFAFGMGIERIAMIKYGINDLRLFSENDKRFLNQFKGVN